MELNKILNLRFVAALLSALFLIGCTAESSRDREKPVDHGDFMELTLSVEFPSHYQAQTRGIEELDENKMVKIDVLVFKTDDDGTNEKFFYRTHAINDNVDNNGKSFKVLLRKSIGSVKHKIVVLANLRDAVDDAEIDFVEGMPKAEIFKLIKFKSDSKWNATSKTNFTPLPMWGETLKSHVITPTTNANTLGIIYMLRSVAKIDVLLNKDAENKPQGLGTEFVLTDVRLYNSRTKGFATSDHVTVSPEGKVKATKPTIPSDAGFKAYYEYSDTTVFGGFIREIYLAENDNSQHDETSKRTCIVVGGLYTKPGDPLNTATKTWYRIDFYKRNGGDPSNKDDYLDIIRNHCYRVNITSVGGPGYETPDIAYESHPINMNVDIMAWDEGEMNDITSDGKYQLIVDKNKFDFFREGNGREIMIYADHQNGWKVLAEDLPDWVQLSATSGATDTKSYVSITTSPLTVGESDRSDYFTITAGTLKKKIYISQVNTAELSISVNPKRIIFRKSGSNAKSIEVTTIPDGVDIFFSDAPGMKPITWLSSGFPPSGIPNLAPYRYLFQPDINQTTDVLSSTVTVYIQDADGNMVSENILITQLASDLVFISTVTNPYSSLGGIYKFTVESDTGWKIDYVTDPASALASGFDNTPKEAGDDIEYSFELTQNNTWAQRTVTFIPTSEDLDFAGQPIIVIQNNVSPSLLLETTSIDFGSTKSETTMGAQVTSNAKWKYSLSDGWENVLKSSLPAVDTEQGTHTFYETTSNSVDFTSKSWTAEAGTPASGTTYTAIAKFETTDHAPAAGATQNLTLSRVVPAFFELKPLGITIPRVGGYVDVKAMTNAAWNASSPQGISGTGNQTPSAYGEKTAKVNITSNTGWSTTTSPVNRTITIEAGYGETTSSITAGTGGSITVSQPGYYISGANSSLTSVNNSTTTPATLTVKGAFPALQTQVSNGASWSVAGPSITAQESGEGRANLTVPANASWTSRNVVLRYLHPGKNSWVQVGSAVAQPGYNITSSSATPVPIGAGGTSTVSVGGYRSSVYVRAVTTGNVVVSKATGTIGASTTGAVGSVVLTILPNPSATATRPVTVQWSSDNSIWNNIASWTQDKGNYKLKTGRIVAKSDLGALTWDVAMGISDYYMFERYPEHNTDNYTLTYSIANGGCAAYSEPGYPAGTWRLPKIGELYEMCRDAAADTGVIVGVYGLMYWSVQDFTKYEAYGLVWDDSWKQTYAHKGYSTQRARCVRKP